MMFSFQTGQSSSQEDISRQQTAKRVKISIACNACRAKKSKCDGIRPVCGPCSERKRSSQSCIYRQTDGTSPSPGMHSQTVRTGDIIESNTEQPSSTVPSGSLFGASSGEYILSEVGNETGLMSIPNNKRKHRNQALPKPLKELPKLPKEASQETLDTRYSIPPRKVADDLLEIYWDYVDSAYPWLDRPSIESAYETLWVKDAKLPMNEKAMHCILNLMFATCCVASQDQSFPSRYQSSGVFFTRAEELMSYAVMDIYNFEIIQILLLTAVYLQHEKIPQKCIRSIRTAIHAAQELGLHIPETTKAMDDPRERDLARRVWNGCVIMDRISSMTFGCALTVPQSVAKQGLNSLVLDSMDPTSETGCATLPSKVNFYISFCRLHHIIGEALETFYNFNCDETVHHLGNHPTEEKPSSALFFDKLSSLFRIDSELNDWARSLHPFFQMPSEAEDPTPTKHIVREANVLRARYLSVRLLLFRPLLLQIHQHTEQSAPGAGLYTDDQMKPHVVFQCQVNCTKAAGDMIEFIVRNLPEQKQAYILPSNWYTVSYVYMAVTILLAAQMLPRIVEYFSAARLEDLLQQSREILKGYEKHPTLASRCSAVLKLLERHIARRGSGPDDGTAEGSPDAVDHDSVAMQAEGIAGPEPQDFTDNLSMVENYSFDWNDWPVFFAQLDDNTPLA